MTATLTLSIPVLAPIAEESLDIITFDEIVYTATEDTSFALFSVITSDVAKDHSGEDSITDIGNFAITIQNLVNTSVVSGATNSTEYPTIYSYAGVADVNNPDAAINAALAAIQLQPTANYNSNFGGAMSYDVVLTTYTDAGVVQSRTLHFDTAVTPVTDGVINANESFVYTNTDSTTTEAKEDGSVAISITLTDTNHDLSSDTDGSVDHNWSVMPLLIGANVVLTHSGNYGTLSWSGGSATLDASNSTATVPRGEMDSLTFTPLHNASGPVTFTYDLTTKETGASNEATLSQSFTFDVMPVVDGLNVTTTLPSTQVSIGTEDTMLQLLFNGQTLPQLWLDQDGSETLKVFSLSNVPEGFQVFYDATGSSSAVNMGGGLWSIPVAGYTPPSIWLLPLKNYSGIVLDIELIMNIEDKSTTQDVEQPQTVTFDVLFQPVADVITMSPTLTFGLEGNRLPTNINIMMDDFDGSETVTLTFTNPNFVSGVLNFQVPDGVGGYVDVVGQSFSGNTYTLTGLTKAQVNELSIVTAEGVKGSFVVDVTAQNTDTGALLSVNGSIINGSYTTTITSHASGVTDFTVLPSEQVDSAISGDTVVGAGYVIPVALTGLDLVDKVTSIGEEQLTIKLSGLGNSLTVDASLVTGAVVSMEGSNYLITLPSASDSNYNQSLADIADGFLKLVSTSNSGHVQDIIITAYSTDLSTSEKSAESSPADIMALNLTVDAVGTIEGTSLNDLIFGTNSNDFIFGGAGQDTFVFNTTLNATTNVDTIDDFIAADDTISLDNAIFTALSASGTLSSTNFVTSASGAAVDADDYILYNTTTGALSYDTDGSGAATAIMFATLGTSTHPMITAIDFTVI